MINNENGVIMKWIIIMKKNENNETNKIMTIIMVIIMVWKW